MRKSILLLSLCGVLIFILCTTSKVYSSCEIDMSDYVGWKIIYSGTVTGYIDDNGKEKDEFEGCEYGRVLIIDYTKQITCQEYNYSYAFHPDIVIMSNGYSLKACIDDEMYDISR